MTYFLTGNPQYHRRDVVSRSCSGWEGVVPTRYGRQAKLALIDLAIAAAERSRSKDPNRKKHRPRKVAVALSSLDSHLRRQHGYRIKPHGQLVSVSLSAYTPSTPDLSTSWSWTTLQGGQASGKTNLQASFPLRCFQRLSLPHIATRQCHWRDNRYTRDASTPVLSY